MKVKSHENNPNRVNKVHETSFGTLFKREFLEWLDFKERSLVKSVRNTFCKRLLKRLSVGTNFQTDLRVIFNGTKTQIFNCWLEFLGEGTTSIYCAQKSR